MAEERLQKILARGGLGSRRKAEELIKAGKVRVNGEVVSTAGVKVDPARDTIEVNGAPLKMDEFVYIMMNKPGDCVCAMEEPFGKKTVADYLGDLQTKVFHVGRLDFDTEGLLLLTNDGDFCQKVTHPKNKVYKTYEACVKGIPTKEELDKLREGITLDDGPSAPAIVRVMKKSRVPVRSAKRPAHPPKSTDVAYIEISIREGRKRQVKRMFGAIDHPTISLRRTRIGALPLDKTIPLGKWKTLTREEAMLALKEGKPGE